MLSKCAAQPTYRYSIGRAAMHFFFIRLTLVLHHTSHIHILQCGCGMRYAGLRSSGVERREKKINLKLNLFMISAKL